MNVWNPQNHCCILASETKADENTQTSTMEQMQHHFFDSVYGATLLDYYDAEAAVIVTTSCPSEAELCVFTEERPSAPFNVATFRVTNSTLNGSHDKS